MDSQKRTNYKHVIQGDTGLRVHDRQVRFSASFAPFAAAISSAPSGYLLMYHEYSTHKNRCREAAGAIAPSYSVLKGAKKT